jgi:hypothetical protein
MVAERMMPAVPQPILSEEPSILFVAELFISAIGCIILC